jgi:hypothetical protein
MSPFEYISLLTSIVLAIGITRILTGVGKVVQLHSNLRIYWVHLMWTANVFLWLLLNWWILFRWHTYEGWTFFLFLFVLVSPIVAFLLSVVLLPEPLDGGTDLKQLFFENRRWFFSLAALLPPIDAIDTLLKGWDHFLAQGIQYPIVLIVVFSLCILGIFSKDEKFHAGFAVFFLLFILAFISLNLRILT